MQLARKYPNIRLSSVCDVLDRNLAYCIRVCNLPKENVTKDFRKVLNSPHIHAVHICTPNETHYQIGKEALEAGKHVLLEKPMTLNSKQAYDLVEMAASKNLTLQVGNIFRFNNALKKTRELLAKNFFGETYYLKLQWTTLMLSPPNRDIIFDLAPHPIDILHYLLNEWPTKVICKAKAYRREMPEEIAYIIAEFEESTVAHIELSWLLPGKMRKAILIGSERCGTIDCLNQIVKVHENEDN